MSFGEEIIGMMTSMDFGLFEIYLLIGVLMFLNTLILTPPSEFIGIGIGIAVYLTDLNWGLAVLIAALANFFGTMAWYYAGVYNSSRPRKNTKNRRWVFRKLSEFMDKVEEAYLSKGKFLVFLLRFVPLIRALCSYPAGKIRMKVRDFALYSIPGLVLWMVIWSLLGVILGQVAVKYHVLVSVGMGFAVYFILKISLTHFGRKVMR